MNLKRYKRMREKKKKRKVFKLKDDATAEQHMSSEKTFSK